MDLEDFAARGAAAQQAADTLIERARRADEDPPLVVAEGNVVDEWVLVPRAHLQTIQRWGGEINEMAAITMCAEILADARLLGRARGG